MQVGCDPKADSTRLLRAEKVTTLRRIFLMHPPLPVFLISPK